VVARSSCRSAWYVASCDPHSGSAARNDDMRTTASCGISSRCAIQSSSAVEPTRTRRSRLTVQCSAIPRSISTLPHRFRESRSLFWRCTYTTIGILGCSVNGSTLLVHTAFAEPDGGVLRISFMRCGRQPDTLPTKAQRDVAACRSLPQVVTRIPSRRGRVSAVRRNVAEYPPRSVLTTMAGKSLSTRRWRMRLTVDTTAASCP
jgi:hypothetical protein